MDAILCAPMVICPKASSDSGIAPSSSTQLAVPWEATSGILRSPEAVRMILHSVRSLFTLHSAGHKRVFLQVWERLLLQTSLCCFLARRLVALPVEQAMLASLLSEIGSLAVLSAFRQSMGEAEQGIYQRLCDEYRGGLGVIMLRKWGVADEYVEVIRHAGDWQHGDALPLGLLDVLNLARWHTLRAQGEAALPALQSLAAYAKLPAALDFMDERGQLNLVSAHAEEIQAILDSLR